MFNQFCPSLLGMQSLMLSPGLIGYNRQSSSGSMSVPSHANGDVILFANSQASSGGTTPATSSGFTSLATVATDIFLGSNYMATRLQWRVSDGTVSSVTCASGGAVFVARGFSSVRGALTGTGGITGVTTRALPNLTGLNTGGTSMLIGGANYLTDLTACTSPFVLTDGRYALVLNNTAANTASKNLTQASSSGGNQFVAEFVV